MKRTVTVNISGVVFTIDEDAFGKLQSYLSTIRGYFRDSDGRDEIMADIEARIAEMLQERLGKTRQVVSMDDINAVIEIMGQPEDYLDPDMDDTSSYSNTSSSSTRRGGKRFYRDGDSRIIGGVCSGFAHYIGVDPVWVRLLFAILFFVGVGSLGLVYIILWIIVPLAITPSEKLEMRGEPINVGNIGKSFEREVNDLNDRMRNANRSDWENKVRGFFDGLFDVLGRLFRGFFKILGKIIGVFLVIGGLFGVITLAVMMFTGMNHIVIDGPLAVNAYTMHELGDLFFASQSDMWMGAIGFFLMTLIPALAIAYLGFRILIPRDFTPRGLGWSLLGAWVLGIILFSYVAIKSGSEFSKYGSTEATTEIFIPASDTLELHVEILPEERNVGYHEDADDFLHIDADRAYISNVDIDVRRGTGDRIEMEVIRKARGRNFKTAEMHAERIMHRTYLDSNKLTLSPIVSFPANEEWRMQGVKVIIYLPEGKTVFLDPSTKYFLDDVKNVTNTYDHNMTGHYWTMTKKGLASPAFEAEEEDFEGRISIEINSLEDLQNLEKLEELEGLEHEEEARILIKGLNDEGIEVQVKKTEN